MDTISKMVGHLERVIMMLARLEPRIISSQRECQPQLHATLITIEVRGVPDQGPNRSQIDSSGVPPDHRAQTGKSAPHNGRVVNFQRTGNIRTEGLPPD